MFSLVVLALAFGLATPILHESGFTPKREYVYRYEAQTVSGIPGASKVYSGVKVIADVRLRYDVMASADDLAQSQSAEPVILAKLENIELYTMNDAIRTQNPLKEQVSRVKMTRFFCPYTHRILMEPFYFRYQKGHAYGLRTPEHEPYWSVNIKRGVVSLMEVNLERRWTATKVPETDPTYEAYELSASGVCRTMYAVEEPEFNREIPKDTMIVTKVKDFENCFMRPDWIKNMFKTKMCSECELNRTLALAEGSEVRYTLKGTRKHFIILSAIGTSHASFYPYSANKERITTMINQTMYLREATDLKEDSFNHEHISKLTMVPRRLSIFLPEEAIDSHYPFAHQTQMPLRMDEARFTEKRYIISALKSIAEGIEEPRVMKEGAAFPLVAVTLMRRANATVLTEIWEDYAIPKPTETKEEMALRKVVWTCMAATGNFFSGKLILETCATKKIPPTHCADLISMVAMANEPNATFVNKFMTVVKEMGENKAEPELVRAVWLGIGVLANKISHTERYEMKELNEAIHIFNRILPHEHGVVSRNQLIAAKNHLLTRRQEVIKLYTDMRAEIVELINSQVRKGGIEPKVIALKTAANAGLPELIPICATVAEDTEMPEFVRFLAVWALEKMAVYEPKLVVESLLPVFMRTTDRTAIRISSFIVIMHAEPSRTVVEMFARHVAREPDLQVSSYIYSFFETMSNATLPCYTKLAKEAANALHLASRVEPGIQYSAVRHAEYYKVTEKIRAGVGVTLGVIGSNSSIVPKAAAATFHAHIFGKTASVFEIGFFTEGIGKAIDKLIGPDGVLTNRKSILDLISPRLRRNVNAQEKMEEIIEKLNVNPRRLPDPTGNIYVKFFGYQLKYFDIEEILLRLATAGKLSVSYRETDAGVDVPVDYRRLFYLGDANIVVPTEAGLPVSISLAATTAVNVKGKAVATVSPALFESRRQSAPIQAKARVNLHPSAVMEITGVMAVHAFSAAAGAAFRIRSRISAPVRANFTANLPRRKIIATVEPPVQEEPIVEIEAYPATFQTISPSNDEKTIQIADGARIVERYYSAGEKTLGLKTFARVKLASPYGNPYGAPIFPFTGRSAVQVFMKPGIHAPKHVTFQAQFTSGATIKSTKGTPPAAQSSCDCFIGRFSLCMLSCEEEDNIDPQILETAAEIEDFPDLMSKDISIAELKAKMQTKLGSSVRLSPFGLKWGMLATVDATAYPEVTEEMDETNIRVVRRKLQVEALWQSVNRDHMHQVVVRVARTPLPTYPEPWEMMTHAMLQYPNRVIHPKMLMDPSYHIQIQKDIQFMTRFLNHRPVLATLNETSVTILQRHMQHLAGNPKPELLLRTLALQLFARTNVTEVRELLPIWRKLVVLTEWAYSIKQRAFDPIFIIKHAESIIRKIEEVENIQLTLIQKVQELERAPPVSMLYVPALQYCIMEHYSIVAILNNICRRAAKMSLVTNAESMYTKTESMMINLDKEIIQYANELAKVSPPPETMNVTLKNLWPKIERISEAQMDALTVIKRVGRSQTFPSLQPVVDVVEEAKETIPAIAAALKTMDTVDLDIVPILLKIAEQHFMVYNALYTIADDIRPTNSNNESQFNHGMRALKAQVAQVALTAAVLVKYRYELITLEPVISGEGITTLKALQKLQLEIGLEMHKIASLHVFSPHAYTLEVPEQIFSTADSVIGFSKNKIHELEKIVRKIESSNVEPTVWIYEKTALAIFSLKEMVRELKIYIQRNLIMSLEVTRCIEITKLCEEVLLNCEMMELNVTKAFERIWLTASQPDVRTSMPMSESLVEVALTATAVKQKEVMAEIETLVVKKNSNLVSVEPDIETLMEACRSLQGQIDWIQLWGLPLGPLSPIFARVITEQQEILKRLRELVTEFESKAENPVHLGLALDDLQGELSRIVKIGSVEMSDVRPIPGLETRPTMATIPTIPINPVTSMISDYLPLAITGYCNISFGIIGRRPKTIIMKLYASKSFEQLIWESLQLNPMVRDESVDRAVAREESTLLPEVIEHPIYHLLNSLNHRHLIVKFNPEEIPEHFRFTLHRVKHFVTSYDYWNTYVDYPVERTSGIVHIMNEAKMDNPANDVFIMTPNETVSMYGIHTPWLNKLTIPFAFTKPTLQKRLTLAPYLGPFLPTTCKAFYKDIRTFDGVEYTLPEIGPCAVVLAMDCSPEKTFAITVRSEVENFSMKTLEIVAENRVIELASTVSGATMTVNGDAVTVTPSKPYILERVLSYGESAVSAKITKDMYYKIDLPLVGIYITTDGNFVEVKASPVFKLKTCGLCSNMDGQQRHEFETPEQIVYNTPEPFIASYIIKGANCPRRTIHNVGGTGRIVAMTNECKPTDVTIIKYNKSDNKICFSMRPVQRCPDTCRPEKNKKITVPFKCLPDSDKKAREIRKQIKNGENPDLASVPGSEARYKVMERMSCVRK